MTGSREHAAAEEMICAFGRSLGWQRLLRGWLYAIRRAGWLRSVRYWPKWLCLLARGLTPRHALYLAAYRWQQQRCGEIRGDSAESLKASANCYRWTSRRSPRRPPRWRDNSPGTTRSSSRRRGHEQRSR